MKSLLSQSSLQSLCSKYKQACLCYIPGGGGGGGGGGGVDAQVQYIAQMPHMTFDLPWALYKKQY